MVRAGGLRKQPLALTISGAGPVLAASIRRRLDSCGALKVRRCPASRRANSSGVGPELRGEGRAAQELNDVVDNGNAIPVGESKQTFAGFLRGPNRRSALYVSRWEQGTHLFSPEHSQAVIPVTIEMDVFIEQFATGNADRDMFGQLDIGITKCYAAAGELPGG